MYIGRLQNAEDQLKKTMEMQNEELLSKTLLIEQYQAKEEQRTQQSKLRHLKDTINMPLPETPMARLGLKSDFAMNDHFFTDA